MSRKYLAIAAVITVVCIAVLVVSVRWASQKQEKENTPSNASSLQIRIARLEEHGMLVQPSIYAPHPQFPWRGWIITNQEASPLIIQKVVYNGEWVAHLGTGSPAGAIVDGGKSAEASLSVGQSQAYFQSCNCPSDYIYDRDVVFVDLYTSRGNFRWKSAEGFTGETPVFNADAVSAAESRVKNASE